MSDEPISDLTERLAAMIERGAAGDVLDWTKMRLAVLELSQRAAAGAQARPVRCIVTVHEGARISELESEPALALPVISSEGVGLRFMTERFNLFTVALGVEGALEMSGELAQGAVQSGTLGHRTRQARAGLDPAPEPR